MARQDSGCESGCRIFFALDLPADAFDGIFAKPTLFQHPRRSCLALYGQLHQSLKPGGVLFKLQPARFEDQEGWTVNR